MYLAYFGIRVTDLDRSLRFYSELFGLKEVARGDRTQDGGGRYVLLRDQKSGQKLELNWYPENSSYGVPYSPGEGLDHIAFRVNNVSETLKQLAARGAKAVQLPPPLREGKGISYSFKLAYVLDPDGNWIELVEHSEPITDSIPEGY